MNQALTRLFKSLRTRRRTRARALRTRTDAVRRALSAQGTSWDAASVLRAIRDGR